MKGMGRSFYAHNNLRYKSAYASSCFRVKLLTQNCFCGLRFHSLARLQRGDFLEVGKDSERSLLILHHSFYSNPSFWEFEQFYDVVWLRIVASPLTLIDRNLVFLTNQNLMCQMGIQSLTIWLKKVVEVVSDPDYFLAQIGLGVGWVDQNYFPEAEAFPVERRRRTGC